MEEKGNMKCKIGDAFMNQLGGAESDERRGNKTDKSNWFTV